MTKWGLHCFVYPLLFGKYLTCPEKKTLYIGIRQAWFMFGVDDAWWWICRMMNDNEWCCCWWWWWRLWFMTMIPGSNLLSKLPVAFFVGYSLKLTARCLPLAHVVNKDVFVTHGGLPRTVIRGQFFLSRACTLLTCFVFRVCWCRFSSYVFAFGSFFIWVLFGV